MSKRKLFVSTALSISTAILLTACGGGGGSSENNTTSQTDNTPSKSDATNKAPTIAIIGDKNITVNLGATYTDLGATATDPEDGTLTVTKTSDIDTSKIGNYKVIYSAKDSKGATATQTRDVTVEHNKSILPLDTNTYFDKEKRYIYFANPRSEEGGRNSVVRIDYKNMKFDRSVDEIFTLGNNPHSIDRAGTTDKFYVRTQNSNSFDIINFKEGTKTSKTIAYGNLDLSGTNPRSIGSYNAKYGLHLLAGKHRPIIALIDVETDNIVGVAGDSATFNATQTYSGHGVWLDDTYFGIVSQNKTPSGMYEIKMYKITDKGDREFEIVDTGAAMTFTTKLHAIERVLDPQNTEDLKTFYALGASDLSLTPKFAPSVTEVKFDPTTGTIKRVGNSTFLSESTTVIDGISPATHHGNISPDHKYYVAPVTDGKVYFLDRSNMKVAKMVETNLDSKHKGLGAAHVVFSASQKMAIVTNHFSNYLTLIDMSDSDVKNYKIKAQIKIGEHAFEPNNPHLMQPHFALVSEDGKYFYTAASHDGIFVRVDLSKIKDLNPADYGDYQKLKNLGVLKTIEIGGVIEQSHS